MNTTTVEQSYTYLDNLSRRRALTLAESMALQRAIAHIDAIGSVDARKWTPEDDAELVKLRKQGLSFTQIGARMRRSKSACCSRYKRFK